MQCGLPKLPVDIHAILAGYGKQALRDRRLIGTPTKTSIPDYGQ